MLRAASQVGPRPGHRLPPTPFPLSPTRVLWEMHRPREACRQTHAVCGPWTPHGAQGAVRESRGAEVWECAPAVPQVTHALKAKIPFPLLQQMRCFLFLSTTQSPSRVWRCCHRRAALRPGPWPLWGLGPRSQCSALPEPPVLASACGPAPHPPPNAPVPGLSGSGQPAPTSRPSDSGSVSVAHLAGQSQGAPRAAGSMFCSPVLTRRKVMAARRAENMAKAMLVGKRQMLRRAVGLPRPGWLPSALP